MKRNPIVRMHTKLFTLLIMLFTLGLVPSFSVTVRASEFSVTPASAILYTTGSADLLSVPDITQVILPDMPDGLPFQVTGVTSNGYFQVSLTNVTYYIAGPYLEQGLDNTQVAQNVQDDKKAQDADVTAKIWALKSQYPEGTRWTNENYYRLSTPIDGYTYNGYGCVAIAFIVSDYLFGDAPCTEHRDFTKLRPGDMVRVNYDSHTVVVIEVNGDYITVMEGNYNSSIHWGRQLKISDIIAQQGYIWTRYQTQT